MGKKSRVFYYVEILSEGGYRTILCTSLEDAERIFDEFSSRTTWLTPLKVIRLLRVEILDEKIVGGKESRG